MNLNENRCSSVVWGVIEPYAHVREHRVEQLRAELAGGGAHRADAFASLLDRSLNRHFRVAVVILGNREDAEDAVSDAALRAWQHVGALRDPARFDAWFGHILVNVCRDRIHQRQRRRTSALAGEPPDLHDAFDESVERAALQQALGTLTPEHRAVVALRYLEGLSIDEIAAYTGTRAGTVKSRLHYGLAELRAAYDAAGRTSEGTIR
jgi:RNA polymerase sigma-70 factor (ECF subfamily)